jgi:hypothetical protein
LFVIAKLTGTESDGSVALLSFLPSLTPYALKVDAQPVNNNLSNKTECHILLFNIGNKLLIFISSSLFVFVGSFNCTW